MQVDVGRVSGEAEHALDETRMLPRRHDEGLEVLRVGQCPDDRDHLDRLGSGPDRDQDFELGIGHRLSCASGGRGGSILWYAGRYGVVNYSLLFYPLAAVLGPWARRHDPAFSDEWVLVAYADNEAAVEAEHPMWLYPDVLREAMTRTGADLGFPVTDADADALARSVPDWPAFPDSVAALGRLMAHYQLIILSNVDRASFAGSNRRLGVRFDAVYTAQDVGAYKPSDANFRYLLEHVGELSVRPGRLLHVAQSLFHDHVPAQRHGLPGVWIDRRRYRPGWGATPDPRTVVTPDLAFESMAAFADAVDAAFAAQ